MEIVNQIETSNNSEMENSASNGMKWWDFKNNYICMECGQKFNCMNRLNAHLITHKEKNFENYKPGWLSNLNKLRENEKIFNEDEKMDVEDFSFSQLLQSKNNFICLKCNLKFDLLTHLNSHLKTCIKEKNKFKHFAGKNKLKNNLSFFASEKYVAGVCDKLKKKIKCEECNKFFVNKRKWKLHVVVHLGKKRFICEECGKCFRQKKRYKLHLVVHTPENKFQCDECEKWFGCKKKWNLHLAVHKQGGMKYQCEESV